MAKKVFVCSRFPNLVNELQKAVNDVDYYDACSIPPEIPFDDAEIPEEHMEELLNSEIVVADFNLIAPFLYKMRKTKWLQGTWAGVDFLLPKVDPDSPPPFYVTRFSGGTLSKQLLEYALAHIINYERKFLNVYLCQTQKLLNFRSYTIPTQTVSQLTVGILGIGAIGGEIGRALKGLGARVLGYSKGHRSYADDFDEYFTTPGLPVFLQKCDYLINVLPETPETKGLLAGDILQNCKARTVFMNIGRGSIIPEADLIRALRCKWLRGAILDVFEKEPLPLDSPLWDMEEVIITPHIAGRPTVTELVALFKNNLARFQENKPLMYEVDFKLGY